MTAEALFDIRTADADGTLAYVARNVTAATVRDMRKTQAGLIVDKAGAYEGLHAAFAAARNG